MNEVEIMKRILGVVGAIVLGAPAVCVAQKRPAILVEDPHLAYLCPAGARRGTTVRITVGGQHLAGVEGARFSAPGLRVKQVLEYEKPMGRREFAQLRRKMESVREKMQSEEDEAARPGFRTLMRHAQEAGITIEEIRKLREFGRSRNDPKVRRNPQLEETVVLEVEVDSDAPLGRHEIRVLTADRVSNPLVLQVGSLPEVLETEPNDREPDAAACEALPVVVNGQIMPGDVDRFSFRARKGEQLMVISSARELIPHLADAVPGWFQATLALRDAEGRELSYADDYRFNPDPVMFCRLPADGEYVIEVKDAIYRGREDFVYRIAIGGLPFVSGVFPLGGRVGTRVSLDFLGKNLSSRSLVVPLAEEGARTLDITNIGGAALVHPVPFAVDTRPEHIETEPNDTGGEAGEVELPVIINGRIGHPGDRDVFSFSGTSGDRIVAEVRARRLYSPLDSVLKITDKAGRQLAINDDHEDPACGLVTHHADSRIDFTLPASGTYLVHLGDMQSHGSAAHSYRLHLGPPSPGFDLRVAPSFVNAPPGTHSPVTVYALRKDGFDGAIHIGLDGAPEGFDLSGGCIPPGVESVRMTLALPERGTEGPVRLDLEGRATIGGKEVVEPVVPSEDRMQAFFYHHLVTTGEFLVCSTATRRPRPAVRLGDRAPVRLMPGRTTEVEMQADLRWAFIMKDAVFELDKPPPGISLDETTFRRGTMTLRIRAEADAAPVVTRGNLIINASIEREFTSPRDQSKKVKRRFPVTTLPAIPCEVNGG